MSETSIPRAAMSVATIVRPGDPATMSYLHRMSDADQHPHTVLALHKRALIRQVGARRLQRTVIADRKKCLRFLFDTTSRSLPMTAPVRRKHVVKGSCHGLNMCGRIKTMRSYCPCLCACRGGKVVRGIQPTKSQEIIPTAGRLYRSRRRYGCS